MKRGECKYWFQGRKISCSSEKNSLGSFLFFLLPAKSKYSVPGIINEGGCAMTISEKVLENMIEKIRSVAGPERIILFGSAARGTMTTDSDMDLLIIKKHLKDQRSEAVRIRKALAEFRIPVDIIVMSVERFEETKNVIGGIAYPAYKYGRILYEAA